MSLRIPRQFLPLGRRRIPQPRSPLAAGVAPYGAEDENWIRSFCMLCPSTGTVVTHVGTVDADGLNMPLLACAECHRKIGLMIHTWRRIRDGLSPPSALRALHAELAVQRTA